MSSSPSTYREQDKCKCNLHFILVGTFRMTLPSFYHNFVTQKILVLAYINRKTIYHNHTHGTQIILTFIHEKCILDIHVIMSYSGLLTWNTTFLCISFPSVPCLAILAVPVLYIRNLKLYPAAYVPWRN